MSNFIVERYIDDTLCDEIIENFNVSDPSWTNSTRGYWLVPSSNMDPQLMERYKQEIFTYLLFYKEIYPDAFEGFANLRLTDPFNVQKYEPNQFYSRWHCENNGHQMFQGRVLAFMTYLNTVDDGGETEFMYQKMKTKAKKGKTLIWPAYFTHTHRGVPSPTQSKYIITGWVEISPWENINLDESDEDFYKKLDAIDTVSRFL